MIDANEENMFIVIAPYDSYDPWEFWPQMKRPIREDSVVTAPASCETHCPSSPLVCEEMR